MARWRLRDAHYINVPGTEWEYSETDQATGRRLRKVYDVPLYLNPKDPADCNYPGEIIVSNKLDPAYRRDILFSGPPTPDMEPIDDEAQEISQGFIDSGAWKHPIESMNMTYSQSVLSEFEQEMAKLLTKNVQITMPNIATGGISQKQFDDLQSTVKQLMEQNATLQAQMLDKKEGRRV